MRCCARRTTSATSPFAVLLGDDLIDERDPLLVRMIGVQRRTRASVVALMEVPPEQVHLYGCAAVEPTRRGGRRPRHRARREAGPRRTPRATSPSSAATCCTRGSSTSCATPQPGRGGEIQLTDALQTLAAADGEGAGVYGVVFRGRRYDTGDRLDYLKAVVQLASERDDLGPDFRVWLRQYVAGHGPGPVVSRG